MEEIVRNWLKANALKGKISCVDEMNVEVEVAREDLPRALSLGQVSPDFYVAFKNETPELVHAQVGDIVMIPDRYALDIDDCRVGIVSSKTDSGYRCCEIQLTLGDQWHKPTPYRIVFTGDDYGGVHQGFLKVLSRDELQTLLLKKLDKARDKVVKTVETLYQDSVKIIPEFCRFLGTMKRATWESVYFSEDDFPPGRIQLSDAIKRR